MNESIHRIKIISTDPELELVGSLFYDALSITRIYSVGDKCIMINWKGFGKKRSWPNIKVLSWHSPEKTEESHEKPQ
jgi:hypothetical protein